MDIKSPPKQYPQEENKQTKRQSCPPPPTTKKRKRKEQTSHAKKVIHALGLRQSQHLQKVRAPHRRPGGAERPGPGWCHADLRLRKAAQQEGGEAWSFFCCVRIVWVVFPNQPNPTGLGVRTKFGWFSNFCGFPQANPWPCFPRASHFCVDLHFSSWFISFLLAPQNW